MVIFQLKINADDADFGGFIFFHFDEGEITPRKQRTAWLSKCDFYFVEMTNFINNLKNHLPLILKSNKNFEVS